MSMVLKDGSVVTTARILPLLMSLRASERRELLNIVRSDSDVFISALEDFLARWATSSWLEEYNVERVGRWIVKNCSLDVIKKSEAIVGKKQAANYSTNSIHDRTYSVFLNGLKIH